MNECLEGRQGGGVQARRTTTASTQAKELVERQCAIGRRALTLMTASRRRCQGTLASVGRGGLARKQEAKMRKEVGVATPAKHACRRRSQEGADDAGP